MSEVKTRAGIEDKEAEVGRREERYTEVRNLKGKPLKGREKRNISGEEGRGEEGRCGELKRERERRTEGGGGGLRGADPP